MGVAGVFDLTPGLDSVWGYRPAPRALDIFTFDRRALVTGRRACAAASIQPCFQELFAANVSGAASALGRLTRHTGGRHPCPAAPR